jgi:hypothetical protein
MLYLILLLRSLLLFRIYNSNALPLISDLEIWKKYKHSNMSRTEVTKKENERR